MLSKLLYMFKNKKVSICNSVNDISNVRNIQERIAGLNIGQCFGLTTREGIKIFKLVQIKENVNKEV